jgi:hypothetical protein
MATSAASALAGNAGGEGGAPASGDQGQQGGGAPAGGEKPWTELAGIDAKYLPAIQAKGWGGINDVMESYANVEKLVSLERGGDVDRILVKPKEGATPEEIAAFTAKAGFAAPAKAEDYGFTPEFVGTKANELFAANGLPAELAGQFSTEMAPVVEQASKWMQAAGVPTNVAQGLVANVLASEVESLKAFHSKSDQDYTALGQEMGDKFADFEEAGRRAFRQSGLEKGTLDKIEMAIGTKAMMQMFAKFGGAMFEAAAPSGDKGGGQSQFTQTAQGAQQRIQTLQRDSDFQAKLLSPNPQVRGPAQKEWEELFKVAYPPS